MKTTKFKYKGIRIFLSLKYLILIVTYLELSGCISQFAKGEDGRGADFYISTDGKDTNPGTIEAPFLTLDKAKKAVRELKKSKAENDILVYIRGGKYYLKETVIFGMEDTGSKSQKITYAAFPGEEPVFASEVNITGWEKLDEIEYPEDLTDQAKGKVWVADLPEEIGCFKTMYDGDRLLQRAKKGFESALPMNNITFHGEYQRKLLFPNKSLKNWPNLEDVEISIFPRARWQHNFLGLKQVDEKNNVAYPTAMCTYQMSKSPQKSPSVYVENVMEALDEPGEWVVNTQKRKIYYWSKEATPGENINVPCLKELLKVEGGIDFKGMIDKPVTDLEFNGLVFTKGERYTVQAGDAGTHSDWGIYDTDNALLRLRGAERVVVEGCKFMFSGENAIRLDLHCQKNIIRNNLIHDIGRSGIILCGYGPGKKNVNKENVVENNYIHHIGNLHLNGIGIYISMSGGNRIAHNLIHHTPFNGIAITGVKHWLLKRENEREAVAVRWNEIDTDEYNIPEKLRPYLYTTNNIIEFNEVHHAMQELGDGNCIYINTSGKDNIIRNNYLHDLDKKHTSTALRTDDHVVETEMYNNIIVNTKGGVTLKQKNNVYNNFIINSILENEKVQFGNEIRVQKGPIDSAVIAKNICYTDLSHPTFIFTKKTQPESIFLQDANVDYNLFYSAGVNEEEKRKYTEFLKQNKEEQGFNSIFANPDFYPFDNNKDFRLKPGSPAFSLGIEPIDASEIGLTSDFPFAYDSEQIDRLFIKTGNGNMSVLKLKVGEEGKLDLIAKTKTGYVADLEDYRISFSLENNEIAKIDQLGNVTAIGEGETIVEAMVNRSDVKKAIQITLIVD